jgi:hypothetical protein
LSSLVWHLGNLIDVLGLDLGTFFHLLCFRVAWLLSNNLLSPNWFSLLDLCSGLFFSTSWLLLPLIFVTCLVIAVVLATFQLLSLVDFALCVRILYWLLNHRYLDCFSSFLHFFVGLLDIRDWLILGAFLKLNLILFFSIFFNVSLLLLADLLGLLWCCLLVLRWFLVSFSLLLLFVGLFLDAFGHECSHHVVSSSRWYIWGFCFGFLELDLFPNFFFNLFLNLFFCFDYYWLLLLLIDILILYTLILILWQILFCRLLLLQ